MNASRVRICVRSRNSCANAHDRSFAYGWKIRTDKTAKTESADCSAHGCVTDHAGQRDREPAAAPGRREEKREATGEVGRWLARPPYTHPHFPPGSPFRDFHTRNVEKSKK